MHIGDLTFQDQHLNKAIIISVSSNVFCDGVSIISSKSHCFLTDFFQDFFWLCCEILKIKGAISFLQFAFTYFSFASFNNSASDLSTQFCGQ